MIDDETSMNVDMRLNDVSTLNLSLPTCDSNGEERSILDFPDDTRIEICVQCDCDPSTQILLGDSPFFVRKVEKSRKGGKTALNILAYNANDLLRRRIVPYISRSNEAKSQTEAADSRMVRLFRETLGDRAGNYTVQSGTNDDPYREAAYMAGLIETPNLAGPWCAPGYSGKFANQVVLQAMQSMATSAESKGTPVFFGIVQDGCGSTAPLKFVTRCNVWGTDRTTTGRALSTDMETLGDVTISIDFSKRTNYIYAQSGDDPYDVNSYTPVPSSDLATLLAADPFVLSERFISDKAWETEDDRRDGAAASFGQISIIQASGTIRNTDNFCFGREWGYGDKFLLVEDGLTLEVYVAGLHFASQNGNVTITGDLATSQKSGSASGLARMVQDIKAMQDEIDRLRAQLAL